MPDKPVTDDDVARAVQETVDEVNRLPPKLIKPPPPENAPPEFRFVEIADRLAEAVLENAKGQVIKAENNLHHAEQMVDEIKGRTKDLWTLLQDFERQVEDYGTTVLEAQRRFLAVRPKGNSK